MGSGPRPRLMNYITEFLRSMWRAMGDPETFRQAGKELLILIAFWGYLLLIAVIATKLNS